MEAAVKDTETRPVVRADGFTATEMCDAVQAASGAFIALLDSLDEADSQRPVPDMAWTVGDVAAHLLTVVRRGTSDRRRADSIEALGELNQVCIDEIETRDLAALATEIGDEQAVMLELVRSVGDETIGTYVRDLHAGVQADIPTAMAYLLWDYLAHGHDIAAATGYEWTIDPTLAALDLRAILPALEPWVIPAVKAGPGQRIKLAFPDRDWSITVTVGNDTYAAQTSPVVGPVAVLDPVSTLLAIANRDDTNELAAKSLAAVYGPT